MSASLPIPQRAGRMEALLSIFSTTRHLRLALPHNLAAELESEQIASAYKAGTYPPADWFDKSLRQSKERLYQFRRSLARSGIVAVVASVLAVLAAAGLGKVHPSLPMDYGKFVSSFGAGLAAWGALLQFWPPPQTFRGTLLHETLHAFVARLLAVTGFALAAFGALWWQ